MVLKTGKYFTIFFKRWRNTFKHVCTSLFTIGEKYLQQIPRIIYKHM